MEKESSAELIRARRELIADDEISLVDIWMVLVRRWKIVVVIFALFLVVGLITALSSPTKYLFSTTIEVASGKGEGRAVYLLEPLNVAQMKLRERYIPDVLSEAQIKNSKSIAAIDVNVSKGVNAVVISSLGEVSDASNIREAHLSVVGKVVDDSNNLIELRRNELEQQSVLFQDQRNQIQARVKDFERQEAELLKSTALLNLEIQTLREKIAEVHKKNQAILSDSTQENFIFKALMAAQELDRYERRLLAVEERLYVAIPQEISRNKSMLIDDQSAFLEYQTSLMPIKAELSALAPARAVSVAKKATKPSGIGKATTVALSILLGLFSGIFAAFLYEFISRANKNMSQSAHV